jgi:hypothetical protein
VEASRRLQNHHPFAICTSDFDEREVMWIKILNGILDRLKGDSYLGVLYTESPTFI